MATALERQRPLRDAYRFPGFRPLSTVRRVFSDPRTRVITLVRRSEKRSVAAAAGRRWAGTTGEPDAYGTCPVATPASTSNSKSAAFSAEAARQ